MFSLRVLLRIALFCVAMNAPAAAPANRKCCFCFYQDIPECSQVALDRCAPEKGSQNCERLTISEGKTTRTICTSRFRADCQRRVAKWILPEEKCDYFGSESLEAGVLDKILPEFESQKCNTYDIQMENHSSEKQCGPTFNIALACATSIKCGTVNVVNHGCNTFRNTEEALSYANLLRQRMKDQCSDCTVTVRGNTLSSNNQCEPWIEFQVTQAEVCSRLPRCGGTCTDSQMNEAAPCSDLGGKAQQQRCCCQYDSQKLNYACRWQGPAACPPLRVLPIEPPGNKHGPSDPKNH